MVIDLNLGGGTNMLALAADLPEVTFDSGDALVVQGQPAPAIYVLVDGSMTIDRDGTPFATTDYPGAVFGEMATVMRRPATATVRATSPSRLHIARDPFAFLARPDVAVAVLRLTANRLDTMTKYLSDVREQYGHLDNHLGMVDGLLESMMHFQAPSISPGSVRDPLG